MALARTLVTEPQLVLLDEPLGALDANLRTRMCGELRRIRERLGVTFLHVTGSETEALAMGDQVIVLDEGRIAQVGPPDEVYTRPRDARVARFLNCYNLIEGRVRPDGFEAEGRMLPCAQVGPADADLCRAAGHDRPCARAGLALRPDARAARHLRGQRIFRPSRDLLLQSCRAAP